MGMTQALAGVGGQQLRSHTRSEFMAAPSFQELGPRTVESSLTPLALTPATADPLSLPARPLPHRHLTPCRGLSYHIPLLRYCSSFPASLSLAPLVFPQQCS